MSFRYDLRDWVDSLLAWLESHRLDGTGRYYRYTRKAESDLDAYGCADAANILYTVGRFPQNPKERAEWIRTLQDFQSEETGIFINESHSDYHTTAHCAAALELFDARPLHPFHFVKPLLSRKGLESFLDGLDWAGNPWSQSHNGAGCCAAFAIAGGVSEEWFDWYFAWLDREADPDTGFWRKGISYSPKEWPGLFGSLAGGFHYLFNYEHLRRPMPYPEKVVDTCLLLLHEMPYKLGTKIGFADIDWVFCLNRALRQCTHRREEALDRLWEVCARTVKMLNDPATAESQAYDDVHSVFGTVCTVAELQRALPGSIRTPKPLKLVLDRRPFI